MKNSIWENIFIWIAFYLILTFAFLFLFLTINFSAMAHEAECKNIDHYLDDFANPDVLSYIRISGKEDTQAVWETLTAMGIKPPGTPSHYLFVTSSRNEAATIIVIFDENECFRANAGIAARRARMILQMAFPDGDIPRQRTA